MFKEIVDFIWETAKIIIIALLIVIPIRYFIFQPFFVRGQSMEPNFHDGDYLIVDELSYRFREPQRGEVVVFKYPRNPSQRYIKRIVGLPGEQIKISEGNIFITTDRGTLVLDESGYLSPHESTSGDSNVFLGKDEYFVLGDNRFASSDSRRWGPLSKNYIIGRVLFRAWPPNALALIEAPNY